MANPKPQGLRNLEDYRISPTVGFLFEDPLERLPEYFEPWNYVGENIAFLLENHQVREYVDQIVPKQLAIPWYHISCHIGAKPVYGYLPMTYGNYVIIDKTKPLDYENLRILSVLPEKTSTSWLYRQGIMYEITSAPGIKAIVNGLNAVMQDDEDKVTAALQTIIQAFKNCKNSLSRIHEGITVKQFEELMVFLAGWGGPGFLYEDGVIMEGVSEEPMQGPPSNVGQSCPFQCFDSALGVEHNEVQSKKSEILSELLSQCLSAVQDFRSYHLQIYTKYQLNAQKQEDDRIGLTGDERMSKVFMKRLQDLRNETTMTKPA